jgi:hypothetical protein
MKTVSAMNTIELKKRAGSLSLSPPSQGGERAGVR